MTSKQRSLIGLAALLSFGAVIQACGSDASDGSTTPTAGAAGAHAGAAGSVGVSGGGAASAGAPAAGAPAGGGGAGGASAGAAGASAGAAGAAAGAGGVGGASAGAGGGGGSAGASPTFAAVKTLIGMSCGTGQCHDKASKQLDFQGTTDLYSLLTKPIALPIAHCTGSTLAVPNDANSLLYRVTQPNAMCLENGAMKVIARMPDNCKTTGTPMCLSAAQVKVITDWLSAGAPK